MNYLLQTTLPFLFLCYTSLLNAQYQILGDATQIDDNCIRLTPSQDGKEGAVWYNQKMDLKKSFDIHARFHFGCSDGGADGMAFVLHNDQNNAMGWGGHGLARAGMWPSLAVEFDSFKNSDEGDPGYDHIAILAHGDVSHNNGNNIAGPVKAKPDDDNIEDCNYYDIRIVWDASDQIFEVYFDCVLRLTYQGDIITKFLDGNSVVTWGFTAATGAKNNEQIVCVDELVVLEPLPDYTMCPGGQIQLEAKGGTIYQWEPTESLDDPNIANPVASPKVSTAYYVTITDDCVSFFDTTIIEVFGDSVSLAFQDSTLCDGQELSLDATTNNATAYSWSNGSTLPLANVSSSGFYIVTVTVNDECISTAQANIQFIDVPPLFFGESPTLCLNESLLLDATFPDATYLWQDGSTESTFEVTEAGFYQVTVEHVCETKTSSVTVGFEESCTDVYFPNAFSPNFDGVNDYFMAWDGGDITNINLITIYNRWGEKVYEAKNISPNDYAVGWNGLIDGKAAPVGVYVFMADILFRNGEVLGFVGEVNLLR